MFKMLTLLLIGLECSLCVECAPLPGGQVQHQQATGGAEHVLILSCGKSWGFCSNVSNLCEGVQQPRQP